MIQILGLDPGINHTGWGVITLSHNKIELLDNGIITTGANKDLSSKLHEIHIGLKSLLNKFVISEASVEDIFINSNKKSSMTLCYSRAILLLTLKMSNININTYSTTHIKKSITGTGHATKDQVTFMVKNTFSTVKTLRHDTMDALAAAICHAYIYKRKKRLYE